MKVTWNLADGTAINGEIAAGTTLMEAGLANNVPGILGECGGNMSCGTCHVVVNAGWFEKTGGPGENEDIMLDITLAPRQDRSRLSCQIVLDAALDGLVLSVPEG